MNVVEFLRARLQEEEAVCLAIEQHWKSNAGDVSWPEFWAYGDLLSRLNWVSGGYDRIVGLHIAMHGPDATLADVASKRCLLDSYERLLEAVEENAAESRRLLRSAGGDVSHVAVQRETIHHRRAQISENARILELVLCTLAEAWEHHKDFDQAWKVTNRVRAATRR